MLATMGKAGFLAIRSDSGNGEKEHLSLLNPVLSDKLERFNAVQFGVGNLVLPMGIKDM